MSHTVDLRRLVCNLSVVTDLARATSVSSHCMLGMRIDLQFYQTV